MLPGIQNLQRLDAINAGRASFSSPHGSKRQKTCSTDLLSGWLNKLNWTGPCVQSLASLGGSGLEPMTHPQRDSWKGRPHTRFTCDTSPAYCKDWPAMLRTHCIGDTVVKHETWSVLCLITHCVTVLDMPLPLSLAIQGCAGNWENFPTRQSHNVIWLKTSPVSHTTLESPVPFSSPVLRSFWSVPQMEWIAGLETRMDPWQ